MALSRIRQNDEEALRDSLPYHWLKNIAIHPRHGGGGRSFFTCRCLDGSLIELEEGEKCPLGCNPISQAEVTPVGPILITVGFFGLLAFLIAKRPFG